MDPQVAEDIRSNVLKWLEPTPFASSSLEPLTGGTANFIYRAHLLKPLENGTEDVLIKHGEGWVANSPDLKIPTSRCEIEEECLKALDSFPVPAPSGTYKYSVRTPKCFLFDAESSTQVQEYLPGGLSLKNYALKNFAAPTPAAQRAQCHQLGQALGRWIREFHDATAARSDIRAQLARNKPMQDLKHMINFTWLLLRVGKFPGILTEAKDVFESVKRMATEELENEDGLQPLHGDFWSGNILLPDAPIQEGVEIPVFVIDWEMAQLGVRSMDLGQMIAELYELWLYKKIDGGLWMVQGFAEGYGKVSEKFAFRTAIQVGCHLVNFGTSVQGWGTPEQIDEVATIGRDLIVNGWQENRKWFESDDLGCLFSQV
ncbi:kinase-like domain-containing protein [Xylariales sp. PMI_506]|nr:kinase-like domain-containing protein [Xylariales sp. PMI_506]